MSLLLTACCRLNAGINLRRSLQHECYHLTRQVATRSFSSTTSTDVAKNNKSIAYWLFGLSGLVAGMVTVGGITRLTRSGLSMTDWKLQGSLPPMTSDEWNIEFERYKQYPEWKQRQNMTVEEFKFIYFWEYGHRMMGRFIGLAFVCPFLYFSARRMIPRSLYPRLALLFGLGGTQGFIGWWMVKSGLSLDPNQKKEIRVSPYRLATHLSFAFTTYGLLLWTALDLVYPKQSLENFAKNEFPKELSRQARNLRRFAIRNCLLVAATVLSGAYVAGNDAGRAYGTFPMMNDEWIPSEILDMTPVWRNFFENTATVQFDHRVLALSTLSAISLMYAQARGIFSSVSSSSSSQVLWKSLPSITRFGLHALFGMCVTQVCLGITTLLLVVPVPLAAVHQAGSLVLLSLVTFLCHSLRFAAHLPVGSTSFTTAATVSHLKSTVNVLTKQASSTVGSSVGSQQRSYGTISRKVVAGSSSIGIESRYTNPPCYFIPKIASGDKYCSSYHNMQHSTNSSHQIPAISSVSKNISDYNFSKTKYQ